jgi:cob(I)alamin adenosyltransferase
MSDPAHEKKMARRKEAKDAYLADRTETRGLLIIHTGPGKGKSTAAFGMALRCLGHGMKVGIVQFIKGAMESAERGVFESFGEDRVVCRAMGEGFTWETRDRDRDTAAARKAWTLACDMIADPAFSMVILDELNIVLKHGYLEVAEVLAAIEARPRDSHVVVTGRNAPDALIERADLVTEMKSVKHPLRAGIKAQPGVEF